MKKEKLLFILGIWVSILTFLGFPRGFKSVLFVLTGLAIIFLAYLFYRKAKSQQKKDENVMHPFVDNVENHDTNQTI